MTCLRIVCVILCTIFICFQPSHCAEIIGGNEVKPHSMPFMVLLESSSGQPACGGMLINPKWVLTAAHCEKIKKVLLGVHSIQNKTKLRVDRKVKRQFPHPCFDKTEGVNDLMLLKLDKAVKETEAVKCLRVSPNIPDPKPGTKCKVAGWGKTNNRINKMSNVLMAADVAIVDRVKCNSPDFYNFNPIITYGMVCAGSVDKKRTDTCQGDSGGPLLCNGVLVGVTSFGGKHCGVKPGVYSFLSAKQFNWIQRTIKKSDFE